MSGLNISTSNRTNISKRCSTPIRSNSMRSADRNFSFQDTSELSNYFTCSNLDNNSTSCNQKNLINPRNVTRHVLTSSPNVLHESQDLIKMKIVFTKKKRSTPENKNITYVKGNTIKNNDTVTFNLNRSNVGNILDIDNAPDMRQLENRQAPPIVGINNMVTFNSNPSNFGNISTINNTTEIKQLQHESSQALPIVGSNDRETSNSNPSNFGNISRINNTTDNQMKQFQHESRQAPPVMGMKALLAKTKYFENSDANIVQDLILSKYGETLLRYYHGSLERRTTRKWFSDGILDLNVKEENNGANKFRNGQVSNQDFSSVDGLNLLEQTQEFIDSQKVESHIVETKEEHPKFGELSKNDDYPKYDSQLFLKEALLDETYCSISNGLNSSKKSSTDPNIIEDSSINTDNISALLSKSSIYSSIKKQPKIVLDTLPLSNTVAEGSMLEYENVLPKQKLEEFLLEASVQREIIYQTSKALNFCKVNKEFIGSNERIEAERILLIASYKRRLYQEEIMKNHYESIDISKNLGSVKISKLQLCLQPNDLLKQDGDFVQHFICLVSCGMQVLFSEVTTLKEENEVTFDKEFRFDGLRQDFEIILSVYSMKLNKHILEPERDHKEGKSTLWPNPKKLFALRRNRNRIFVDNVQIQQPSFLCCGKTHITLNNLTSKSFRLTNVPLRSDLTGSIKATIHSEVHIFKNQLEGFLNVGMDINGLIVWNRRWCVLHGEHLMCWNYPCGEFSTKPIAFIDLRDCLSTSIGPTSRDVCARPKTLSMDIRCFDEKSQVVKDLLVFLSSDTMEEMKMWNERINSILNSLANWHCLKYLRT